MARYSLAAAVVLAEIALRHTLRPEWTVPYAVAVLLIVVLCHRSASAAFVGAVVLMAVAGPGYVLLPWAGWHAGRSVVSRTAMVAVAGAVAGAAAGQVVTSSGKDVPSQVAVFLVLVVLPVLAGRYTAQHRRLLDALAENNRRLEQGRGILAEQERLRERLRIARDMHDSLGHRLSLVSVQAAALEVGDLPPAQRAAVERLAGSARGAMDELYELVGALRAEGSPARGLAAIPALVDDVRASGVEVEFRKRGAAREVASGVEESAYRVVEEGLTNAAKHAPGEPVSVDVAWEPDALLVTVANPCPPGEPSAGHGLVGLGERVALAGGLLDHRREDGRFRLAAMLPVVAPPVSAPGRARLVAVGLAAAVLVFGLLQVGVVTGGPT